MNYLVCGMEQWQNGFLFEPPQRQRTRSRGPTLNRHHPLRRKGRRRSRIRPPHQDQPHRRRRL